MRKLRIYEQHPPAALLEPEQQDALVLVAPSLWLGHPEQVQAPGGHVHLSPQLQAESAKPDAQPFLSLEVALLGQLAHVHWPLGQEQVSPQLQASDWAALLGQLAHLH